RTSARAIGRNLARQPFFGRCSTSRNGSRVLGSTPPRRSSWCTIARGHRCFASRPRTATCTSSAARRCRRSRFPSPSRSRSDGRHDLNDFVRAGRVRIFDWGDSGVAHPLWSWLKPLDVASRRGVDADGLRSAYLTAWTSVAPEEQLREALRIAVPVGRFAYAL